MNRLNPASAERAILTVSDLNRQARVVIEERFNQIWVMGEMSNFARPRSGHWYFTLKDDNAQVRCAMFVNRNRHIALQPGDGQLILLRGRVSLYEGRGEFQIIVEHMEPAGEGALRQAFEQLKVKLAGEGLFAVERKRPLPRYPTHCVVITSATGAALQDVLSVWARRFAALRVTLIPVAVQGEAAEQEILDALHRAPALNPDIILLTRGGGSLEDLWTFNSEHIARAIVASPIPVVSAVGHEIDVTISDYVADMRAPTPSAAAELIVPDGEALAHRISVQQTRLANTMLRLIERAQLMLHNRAQRIISPQSYLEQAQLRIDDAIEDIQRAVIRKVQNCGDRVHALGRALRASGPQRQVTKAEQQLINLQTRLRLSQAQLVKDRQQRLQSIARLLHGVSPLPTLERGYAVVRSSATRQVITQTDQINPGDQIRAYLSRGALLATVDALEPESSITQPDTDKS